MGAREEPQEAPPAGARQENEMKTRYCESPDCDERATCEVISPEGEDECVLSLCGECAVTAEETGWEIIEVCSDEDDQSWAERTGR